MRNFGGTEMAFFDMVLMSFHQETVVLGFETSFHRMQIYQYKFYEQLTQNKIPKNIVTYFKMHNLSPLTLLFLCLVAHMGLKIWA